MKENQLLPKTEAEQRERAEFREKLKKAETASEAYDVFENASLEILEGFVMVLSAARTYIELTARSLYLYHLAVEVLKDKVIAKEGGEG